MRQYPLLTLPHDVSFVSVTIFNPCLYRKIRRRSTLSSNQPLKTLQRKIPYQALSGLSLSEFLFRFDACRFQISILTPKEAV